MRRGLSLREQRSHAERTARNIITTPLFLRARRIAVYFPNDGEVDTAPLVSAARKMGKRLYLPLLSPFQHRRLIFMEWRDGAPLGRNRFGIPEPCRGAGEIIASVRLDLVITPLVAFDRDGTRLGMGGGYYDVTFARRSRHLRWRRPRLLGLAHSFQMVRRLDRDVWDIPLDAVATEEKLLSFS